MADVPARTELKVTTGPIRGSRKIHVGPLGVAMREIDLEPSSGEPPLRVYDCSGPYTDPAATIDIMAGLPAFYARLARSLLRHARAWGLSALLAGAALIAGGLAGRSPIH